MPPLTSALLILAGAYLLGSIPFGLLVGRLKGVDIREHGSKNIGATNVWRVFGWRYGLPTFLGDLGKGLVAVLLAQAVGARCGADAATCGIIAAVGCILGHNFPVWLRFRGGKGVATSLGVLIGVMPLASLLDFVLWGIIFKLTRYVSLASVLAALGLPVIVMILLLLGWMHGWASFYFAVAAGLMVTVRHTANIKRLFAGTESRFGTKPNPTDPAAPAQSSASGGPSTGSPSSPDSQPDFNPPL